MLDFAYFFFILSFLAYLLLARRKELPLLVISHGLLQYFFTLIMWFSEMESQLSSVTLLFIVATSTLLIWARGLNYSREFRMIKVMVELGQWIILLAMGLFLLVNSPFSYHLSSRGPNPHLGFGYSVIHPWLKSGGNLLIFTTYLLILLNWGSNWPTKKSLKNFAPILIYFLLIALLYVWKSPFRHHAFT